MARAYVALEDGRVVEGRSRAPGSTRGELVFTTAYAGYEESLTDPSYERQVLTFAYPHLGNYGVRSERFESDRVHPAAVIARDVTDAVADWLGSEGVPAVDRVDTRGLVRAIREGGAMRCGVAAGESATPETARAELAACAPIGEHTDIGARVSVSEPVVTGRDGDGPTVALVDCGTKRSIVDSLVDRGATVHRLPYDAARADLAAVDPDLLFLSNGPGDPATFDAAAELVLSLAGEVPIAGVCLGQQIVARALGGGTEKMRFGHRGVNQPVKDLASGQVLVTTQNHGYTVTDPGSLAVTQVNVNDDTPEGLASGEPAVLTRQYHPEARPGPHDTLGFFDDVLAMATSQRSPDPTLN